MRWSGLSELRHRLVRNVASNYVGLAVQAVVALLLIRFLVHRLGDTRYGLWMLFMSILGLLQLAELGIVPAVIRYVSLHRAREEHDQLEAVLGSAFTVLLGLSVLTLPVAAVLAAWGPALFKLESGLAGEFRVAIWLVAGAAIVAFFRRLFSAVTEGYQRFPLLNLCAASGVVLGALLSVWVVLMGFGLAALAAVLLLQTAYEMVFLYLVVRRVFGLRVHPRHTTRQSLRHLAGFSSWAFLMDAAVNISHRADVAVIGIFLPESAITPYSNGKRLAYMLENITDPMIDVFFPLAAELDTTRSRDRLRALLVQGTCVSLLLLTPALLMTVWHGDDLITFWLGAEYVAGTVPVLQVFLGVIFMAVLEGPTSRILLGMGRVKFDAIVSMSSAATKVLLSLALIGSFGIRGVALGTFVAMVFWAGLVAVPYTCRLTGTPVSGFYVRALWPSLLVAIPSLAFMGLTGVLLEDRLLLFLLNGSFTSLAAAAVFLFGVRPGLLTHARPEGAQGNGET